MKDLAYLEYHLVQNAVSSFKIFRMFCQIGFISEHNMVSQYAQDQPAGFVNNLQTVAIVGVSISKTTSHLLPLLKFEFAEVK